MIPLYLAVSVSVLIGCSQVRENKRIPASVVEDVGIIGPDGGVIIFYKEADYIIVKNCDAHTLLGATTSEARTNCSGIQNQVPLNVFKNAVKNLVSSRLINNLRPLTPEEVTAFENSDLAHLPVENMVSELEKINRFIKLYGAQNADIIRRDDLIKSLDSVKARERAIQKIDSQIETAIKLITDNSKLTIIKFNSDQDQFLYTTLKKFDPASKYPCGLSGGIYDRIRDCSHQQDSRKERFVLVSRQKDFSEIYQEVNTGLLWGDELPTKEPYYLASNSCDKYLKADSELGKLPWRLPTKFEFEEAERNFVRTSLPRMESVFWTSSAYPATPNLAWVFSYKGYSVLSGRGREGISARCVVKI